MSTDVVPSSRTGGGTLRRTLTIQGRVIHALLLRELITRFGRRNLGVLWLVAEPMMFTVGVAAMWSAVGLNKSSRLPIVAFAVTGYSSVLLWRNVTSYCVRAIPQNFNLMFHRNVRALDVFLARIVLECGGATASFVLLCLLFTLAGWMSMPSDPMLVLAGWLMLMWFSAALALTIGAASGFSELIVRIWLPIAYLLWPLSGAAFMVSALPQDMQNFVLLLPMVHGVEWVRDGFFGDIVTTRYDVSYMAWSSLLLTFLGMLLVRIAGRTVDEE